MILGGEGKVDLRLRDLFSQVLKKHTKEEADELFICGTKYTTPAPDKISTAWPKPWLFSRVGALLIATFFILLLCCKSLDNGVVIPGIMFVGSMAIPFSMLIFLFEINAPRNISIFRVVSVFMLGGAAACFTAITLEKLSSTEKITVGVAVFIGVVEEIGKIIIMAYTMNKLKTTKYILNGMLVGGAIGAGVSVFESAGYAFGAYIGVKLFGMFSVQTVSSIDNMVANILIRAFLSPGTHIAWSAMEGTFLVIVLAGEAFTWSALRSKKYITLCTIPVAMHAFWDMPVLDIKIGYFNIKMVALEILALIIILVILSRGLS